MREKRVEEIRQKLSVFSFPRLQELVTLSNLLEKENISLKEIKEFINSFLELQEINRLRFDSEREKQKKFWKKITKKCPECGKPLDLAPVGCSKGKANKFGYKSYWSCSGEDCLYDKYTTREFKEIIEELRRR